MKHLMSRMSKGATTMIRMDHTHALATFHQVSHRRNAGRK